MRNPSGAKYCKGCSSSEPISLKSVKHTAPINHGTIPATAGWTCKSCGTKNSASAVYCKSCGTGR